MGSVYLNKQRLDHIAEDIREAEVASLVTVGQLGMANAEEVEQCRVEVMDTDWVFRDVVAVVIRGAIRGPALDARAKHKHREAPWMVITAILIHRKRALRVNRSAKLAAPDDNRVFEEPTLLEVLNECPGRLVSVADLALNRTW